MNSFCLSSSSKSLPKILDIATRRIIQPTTTIKTPSFKYYCCSSSSTLTRNNTTSLLFVSQQRCLSSSSSSGSSSSGVGSSSSNATKVASFDNDDDSNNINSTTTTTTTTTSSSSNTKIKNDDSFWSSSSNSSKSSSWFSTPSTAATAAATTKTTASSSSSSNNKFRRQPILAGRISPKVTTIPNHIQKPPYADNGIVPYNITSMDDEYIPLHNTESINKMRIAAKVARNVLDLSCSLAIPGITTDEIDKTIHSTLINTYNSYPSPLNYSGFPKSLCSSINEVICHGIPDNRPLQFGDIVSFDVSCYVNGVHGDNCATIIVGDTDTTNDNDTTTTTTPNTAATATSTTTTTTETNTNTITTNNIETDWRGIPVKTKFQSLEEKEALERARRLVNATRESLYAAIDVCIPYTGCLSDIGNVIQDVADSYGYSTIERYRGHGIGTEFHCAPFVKHYRNNDKLQLRPGMIFTIEPMLVEGSSECFEWSDNWTVATVDGGMAAQFEHTIVISEDGKPEILTLP